MQSNWDDNFPAFEVFIFIDFSFISDIFYAVEHVFNMVSIMVSATKAMPQKNPLQELFEVQVPFLFILTELTWWKAILSKWFNIGA